MIETGFLLAVPVAAEPTTNDITYQYPIQAMDIR